MVDVRDRLWNARAFTTLLVLAIWISQAGAVSAGVELPSPSLPPESNPTNCGALVSEYEAIDVFALYPNGIDVSWVKINCFTNVSVSSGPTQADETQSFDAVLTGTWDDGSGPQPMSVAGSMTTVAYGKSGDTIGTWQVEIVSANLSGHIGGVSIDFRESPGLPSIGQTAVTDLGGGVFQIDSFFDVFLELSIDGNPFDATVAPAARIDLVATSPPAPVPSIGPLGVLTLSILLLAAGTLQASRC